MRQAADAPAACCILPGIAMLLGCPGLAQEGPHRRRHGCPACAPAAGLRQQRPVGAGHAVRWRRRADRPPAPPPEAPDILASITVVPHPCQRIELQGVCCSGRLSQLSNLLCRLLYVLLFTSCKPQLGRHRITSEGSRTAMGVAVQQVMTHASQEAETYKLPGGAAPLSRLPASAVSSSASTSPRA